MGLACGIALHYNVPVEQPPGDVVLLGQPGQVTDHPQDCNDEFSPEHIEKLLREMKQANDPANLPTVTMRELYETV